MKTTIPTILSSFNKTLRNSINHAPSPRTPFVISLLLVCFALLPRARAVCQEGCDGTNFNAFLGDDALINNTTGAGNTALGWRSLFSNTDGSFNTGVGGGALVLNNADSNTAVGAAALLLNTTGAENTAIGTDALVFNDSGSNNTAFGAFALFSNTEGDTNTASGEFALYFNTTGGGNTATGYNALYNNTTGNLNTATGSVALYSNTTGAFNTATGLLALENNTTGDGSTATGTFALQNNTEGAFNTAIGDGALFANTTGANNTAIGFSAGANATTGGGNVYIGQGVGGVAGESNHTYIRNIETTTVSGGGTDTVTVNLSTGLLGHLSSSRRYKQEIQPMDAASETLYQLRPVTFRYKKEIDTSQSLDYGLIAEDVAEVDPNLANRNRDGQIESVRYNSINAMLLNEFLKEHRKVQQLESTVTSLAAIVKEQAGQIQKVSAQLELSKPASQVARYEQ